MGEGGAAETSHSRAPLTCDPHVRPSTARPLRHHQQHPTPNHTLERASAPMPQRTQPPPARDSVTAALPAHVHAEGALGSKLRRTWRGQDEAEMRQARTKPSHDDVQTRPARRRITLPPPSPFRRQRSTQRRHAPLPSTLCRASYGHALPRRAVRAAATWRDLAGAAAAAALGVSCAWHSLRPRCRRRRAQRERGGRTLPQGTCAARARWEERAGEGRVTAELGEDLGVQALHRLPPKPRCLRPHPRTPPSSTCHTQPARTQSLPASGHREGMEERDRKETRSQREER